MPQAQTYQSEFTGAQMDARFTAVAQLTDALEALTAVVAQKYVKPASGIPSTDMDADVQAALAKANSAIQSLADYYTKSEVDQLLAAINGMNYVDVATLPTASASTMGKIYLVGPDGSGYYAYYYTSYDGSDYSWVGPLGTTQISLANYATKTELSQLDQEVNGKPRNYTAGYYLKSDGTLAESSAGAGVTDFIPYTSGNAVLWRFASSNKTYYLGFYRADKTYISGSDFSGQYSATNQGRLISATQINSYASGAAYIRASFTLDYAGAQVKVGDTVAWTPQEASEGISGKVTALVGDVGLAECEMQPMKIVGANLYQALYIYKGDSKITAAATNGSFCIPVTSGEKYNVRGTIKAFANYVVVGFATSLTVDTTARALVTVDSDNNNYALDYDFTAPDDGYLIVWSTSSVYGSSYYVEVRKLIYRQKPINDYYLPAALKVQVFGDSISDNSWGDLSSWVNYLPDNVPIASLTVVNSAIGGGTLYSLPSVVENGGTNTGGDTVPALQSDADFVVVFIGTNDWAGGRALADCQASLATVLQYITEHSKAKVLFCTPLQRYNESDEGFDTNALGEPVNANNISLREFCDGIALICKVFSTVVLNLHDDAEINRYNVMDYTGDGLHPHRDGDIYISRLICKKIKEMLRN